MPAIPFLTIFIAASALSFLLEEGLEFIDYKARKKNGGKVPKELFGYADSRLLRKTCEYEDAKYRLFIPEHAASFVLSLVLVLSGYYPAVYRRLVPVTGNGTLTAILFFLLASLPEAVLSVPFGFKREFDIEKRYGFSNMTFGMWLLDGLKGLLVGLLISCPLIALANVLLLYLPGIWWILLSAAYIALSLAVTFLYPIVIAPLFNKFTPLESAELKMRLEALLGKTGFQSQGIFVMDASKRSRHSNAYFTGFGKSKRVVLYDTLLDQLSVDETESVLAHELGHYKLSHIIRRLSATIPLIVLSLLAVSVLVRMPSLYSSFGFEAETSVVLDGASRTETVLPYIHFIGLFLCGLVAGPFSPLLSLVSNFFSRRDEFQADAFSAETCGRSRSLVTALIKLHKENLSELTPPKIYCVFNYSHPPLLERIRALGKDRDGADKA
ncbi:MAG: M48 family metallopeptidase [Treponema sp.]|nr:M48 family metallopeptidase [Treponema sp.]